MPYQYIHTSARRGLEPGKSGFCCIARDRELPRDLGIELERMSRFDPTPNKLSPVICRHLKLSIRSGVFHVLTRIQDAGIDYSKRNNHIAHHLTFSQAELPGLPDPATLLLYWNGWKNVWHEPPRVLNEKDQFKIQDLNTISENGELELESGLSSDQPVERAFTIPEGSERDLLLHIRSQLLSLPVGDRWDASFTNFILTSENPTQYLWRGNWKGRALPFEFEAVSKPADASEAPPPSPDTDEPEPAPTVEEATTEFSPRAPTVEIPEELTAEHRRRPKRRWTQKRVSRTLNWGLGVIALLCVGIFAYIVSDFRSPGDSQEQAPAAPVPGPVTKTPAPSQATPRERWEALAAKTQIGENIEESLAIATELAAEGDPLPEQIVRTLAAVARRQEDLSSQSPVLIPVENTLVFQSEDVWTLHPLLAGETAPYPLSLVPEPLFPFYTKNEESSPALPALELPQLRDQFIAADALIRLKTLQRQAKDALNQNGIEAVTAAEDYLATWKTLEGDKDMANIQKLESLFDIESYEAFFAVDENNLLLMPNQTDIALHLRKLYEQFILPRFSSFGTSPEFRLALNAAGSEHDTAISLARAIHEVFAHAQPVSSAVESKLAPIRDQWREIFIRDDLMEETIINFNLERLANSKRALARLQFQFPPSMVAELEIARKTMQTLQDTESVLAEIDSNTRWALLLDPAPQP